MTHDDGVKAVPVCEHHWVHRAQRDYPEWLAFIAQCSLCGSYGPIDLRDGWSVVRTGPDWLPGQPGDVAEFMADCENDYGDPVRVNGRWMRGVHGWWTAGMGGNWLPDADVPADAVLVLPAKTRGQS